MKRLLTFFTLALVLVACDRQPVGVDAPDALFAKPDKPPKPPKPASAELITFTGDLEGSAEVAGCCPNAGPFPEYTMTLVSPPFPAGIAETHTGNIFMNSLGRKVEGDYVVQFWWGEEPDNDYFLEIRGGEKVEDKKTKALTVTFDHEEMTIIDPDEGSTGVFVSFTLTRAPMG
ncbi:MAG: hypothetical protein HKO65_17860 [Gemmatimonadetes bacterium]|nr:hypothetical protein [Gemmatimonadota bacterium]NNM06966.1 hypothetical protein [Gemmatimonadota bacterium]